MREDGGIEEPRWRVAPPGTWMTSPTKYNLTAIDRIGLPEGREGRKVKVLARDKGFGT